MLLLVLLLVPLYLLAQLTLKVTSVPENTPIEDDIYATGTFNNWDPQNDNFILTNNGDGTYEIAITTAPGEVKFKFTRGGWNTVEGNAQGNFQPDHVVNYQGGAQTVELPILSWEDLAGNNSTAAGNVTILSESFYMPQLNKNRRIWVYLPPDYQVSNKSYPVLYIHDGQNVFDAATSFSGEWEVDESLNSLFEDGDEGIIVVAIDNGGASRFDEYSPWVHPQYGGGQGDEYMAFLVETLKPHIDANYRTRPEREHTGLMGSSMGGLISLYGAIQYQEVFSKAGVFSPAFWVAPEAYTHVTSTGKQEDMRIYLLAGEQESESMVPDMQQMYNTLLEAGFDESELFFNTHADGQHSEWYWAREFPGAYIWLYSNSSTVTSTGSIPEPISLRLLPNPTDSLVRFKFDQNIKNPRIAIYTTDGTLVLKRQRLSTDTLNVSTFPNGMYILNVYNKRKLVASQRLVIVR